MSRSVVCVQLDLQVPVALGIAALRTRCDVVGCNMHIDHLIPRVPKRVTRYREALVLGHRVPAHVASVGGYEVATFG